MYKIVSKKVLNPTVIQLEIYAPLVANKAKPGQFIILRVNEDGERIPLTVAGTSKENGTVKIIFQVVGGTTKLLSYKEENEKEVIAQGNKMYGERKNYYLDEKGIQNPLSPSAWYSAENVENSLSADERAYFEKLLNDKGVEKTRADAIIRGPLVVISVSESDNIVTIDGNNAAKIFNIRSLSTLK